MPEPAELLAAVRGAGWPRRHGRRALAGWRVRVLVTAGGTREPIDSVRYVGNRSSGGWASRWPSGPPAGAPR